MERNQLTRATGLIRRKKNHFKARLLTTSQFSQHPANDSLLSYAHNVTSQIGQDGIIQEIAKRLEISTGFFVEFGAWDGIHLSNSRQLYLKGWKGVFIEGSESRYVDLVDNYANSQIILINEFVSPATNSSVHKSGRILAEILSEHLTASEIKQIDMVGIDIDGLDLEVAVSLGFSPKFMVIEGGTLLNPEIDSPYPAAYDNSQHPLAYIIRKLREIGYQPVCFHQDLYVVRNDLAEKVHKRAFILNAQELYLESLALRGKEFLRWLVLQRLQDSRIKKFEQELTGIFNPNPTHTKLYL
jgi:hypothetical protein